jgi:hypothetical protein
LLIAGHPTPFKLTSVTFMKIAFAFFAAAAFIFASSSCDKHSWDSTKGLHEGTHKAHHGDAHAAPHGEKDAHAPAAGH